MELPGSRETARLGAAVLAVLYLALAPWWVLSLDGGARLTMVGASLVSSAGAALSLRQRDAADARRTARQVWFVCCVPLVDSLLHLLVTGRLEETTMVMLAIVGVGAVMTRADLAALLGVGGLLGWAGVVAVTHPRPTPSTGHFAGQLLLAFAMGAAVLAIRTMVGRRLAGSESLLVEQLLMMEGVRGRLSESLAQFRGVFDDSPVAISLADEHGRFRQVNPALCRLLARPADQIVGRTSLDFAHRDDHHLHHAASDLLAASTDGIARVEKRYLRPDGEVRWAWLAFTHVRGPQAAVWTLAHIQDVTDRKKASDALARTREALVAAAQVARVTQLGGDPRPVVTEHLQKLSGASSVLLIEQSPDDDDVLVITASRGRPDLRGFEFPLSESSATEHVWRTGEPLFLTHAEEHPLVSRRLQRLTAGSALQWQPVVLDGVVQAVLTITWDADVAVVTEVERSVVEVLAAETGAALVGERLRRRLEQLGERDPLTGLLNRRGWDREAARLLGRSRATGAPLTLAVVDLDHFKAYNDTHGHHGGDALLAGFAGQAARALRGEDALARWGGEEFVLALPGCDAVEALRTVERVRAAVPGDATCSVGLAELGEQESLDDCLGRADMALYRAKALGRDRSVAAGRPAATDAARGTALSVAV